MAIALNQVLDVSVNVHKDILNLFFEMEGKEYTDECPNKTSTISLRLKKHITIAKDHGSRKNLRVICEPTGQYQNKFLRTARRLGCFTNYVNAESVNKFRIVETNDTGRNIHLHFSPLHCQKIMAQVTPHMRIMLAVEPGDFKKSIDGLAGICRKVLHADPLGGSVFIFRNRKSTTIVENINL